MRTLYSSLRTPYALEETMKHLKVLISGAGIAGPALALCLARWGARVTLVERAPTLREGGQAVDFRGPVHRQVLECMGIWDAIHERRTQAGELWLIDRDGMPQVRLPELMLAGDVEIVRGDLCRLLYERTKDSTDYRFGDQIVGLTSGDSSVDVRFEHGADETFDVVVGADGLHSATRTLAFGSEASNLRHHGYRVATFGVPNLLGRDRGGSAYSEPGRCLSVAATSATQARALLVYTGPAFDAEERDPRRQKAALRARFHDMGWRVAEVLACLDDAQDLYVDSIATVHVPSYARGRVALLGDAAYGGTLGGQGTSLAVVGAFVLASELALGPSPEQAFSRYEAKLRPYASGCQKGATRVGGFFAPRSAFGIGCRNAMYRLLTSRAMAGVFERLVKSTASDFTLPEYPRVA
jgi:2-polyprenyl-6-methoxyphenol hydroxylase-like FAD-dependent oxidoreductase